MAKLDITKLRKLPPDERIKLLKELKEKLKKAKEEEEQDIEAAESLLEEAAEEQRVLEEIEAPKVKEVKVDELFKLEEGLEEIAREAPEEEGPGIFSEQQIDQYASPLAQQPVENLYQKVKEIQEEIKETGVQTVYQQNMINTIGRALYMKEDATEKGEYTPGQKQRELMTLSEQIVKYNK